MGLILQKKIHELYVQRNLPKMKQRENKGLNINK